MPKTTTSAGAADLAARIDTAEADLVGDWVAQNLRDPDDQAAVAGLLARWKAKDAIDQLNRARRLVQRDRKEQARWAREADPDYWAPLMAAAGWQSIRAVWPDAPVPADWGLSPGTGWSIDNDGAHITTPIGGRQLVCTPVVTTNDVTPAILRGGRWVTVPFTFDPKDRSGQQVDSFVAAVIDAGLSAARSIVFGPDNDHREVIPGTAVLRWWLFGIDPLNGGIGRGPCRSFVQSERSDRPLPDSATKLNTAEVLTRRKLGTAEALTRQPRDVRRVTG